MPQTPEVEDFLKLISPCPEDAQESKEATERGSGLEGETEVEGGTGSGSGTKEEETGSGGGTGEVTGSGGGSGENSGSVLGVVKEGSDEGEKVERDVPLSQTKEGEEGEGNSKYPYNED